MKRNGIRFCLFFYLTIYAIPSFGMKNKEVETYLLKDYIVHRKQDLCLVIDKNSLTTFTIPFNIPLSNYFVKSKGNVLYYNVEKGRYAIDISLEIKQCKRDRYRWVCVLLIFFFLLAILYFIIRRSKRTASIREELPIEKHSFYEKIIAYEGQPLRTHQIDELFDIQKLSYDSRKLKRHRLIQEINKKHPNLIQRVKDNEDQRKYLYIINK